MLDFTHALIKHARAKGIDHLQKERAEVCTECPEKEIRNYATFLNSKIVEINGYVCTRCDCPLATKIFAEDKKNICPLWKQ